MRLPLCSLLVGAVLAAACRQLTLPTTPSPAGDSAGPTASPSRMAVANVASPTRIETPSPLRSVDADTFPDPEKFSWVQVLTGLQSPVDIQFPSSDPARMYVVEQLGRIRVSKGGQFAAAPFLDISDRVNSRGNEQGLLGLAFHPKFAENRLFFVNYTDNQNHNVIARFQAPAGEGQADAATETILISVDDPFPNHNGGVLAFGPDGRLYAGLGDGGSANDPLGNGQDTNTLLGKILRVDVDRGEAYSVPPDNPFTQGEGRPEIWAHGLRNPWRISFDMATGDLYIADVGQNAWEEVDFLPAGAPGGANFGWNYREGAHSFRGSPPPSLPLTDPVAEYSHSEGGCSITGGYVYRGKMPEWNGIYLYGDYCSGKIWGLIRPRAAVHGAQWRSSLLFQTAANITAFGQDPAGEIYLADRGGAIYSLQRNP